MKLEFETVKEFLEFFHENDFSFLENYDIGLYDYVCFEVEQNCINVYAYNSEEDWEDGYELIESIYGTFWEDGGSIDLSSDNGWPVSFSITKEQLSVGTIYKLKIEPPTKTPIPEPEPERFIEL